MLECVGVVRNARLVSPVISAAWIVLLSVFGTVQTPKGSA